LTGWNLALDEVGRPNIGPFNCGGLVTINSATKEVSYSGQFWALSQFSRFVRRGARRFQSLGDFKDLAHVAFQNPDGSKVVVLTNSGTARTISLELDSWQAEVQLEPNSLTTLVWN
jgi:glucosylceramidase